MNCAFRHFYPDNYKGILDKNMTDEKAMKELYHIYEYCIYDADACRLLWIKRNLIH